MSSLILKRASASRSSGQWRDDYDVLETVSSSAAFSYLTCWAAGPSQDVNEAS
jgi:hypothetical protein